MSTISDVLMAVRDILLAQDQTTEVLKGERYLKQEGAANRVLFVITDGTWGGAPKLAAKLVGAVNDGCTAYIWGVETTDDFTRDAAALVLRARIIGALHRVAPGRIAPGAVRRMRDTNLLTYGEEYQIDFTYREDIGAVKSIALLPAPGGPTSPPDPLQPPGSPVGDLFVNITVTPEDA